jgi:hypothetical protein
MLVELDIFSGRPNPRWQLDEPSGRRLAELHHGLRPAVERPPDPPGLGYRGFIYTLEDASWRAWKGAVVGPRQVLADPDVAIERWLLDQLPTEYGGLRPRIAAELERTG